MSEDWDAGVADFLTTPEPKPPLAPALKLSMAQAVDVKPDYEAELRRAATATGVPIDTARTDPKTVLGQHKAMALNLDGLAETNPATASFLADSANAKVAHDDVGVLASVEQTLKNLGNLGKAAFFAAASGSAGYLQAMAPTMRAIGVEGPLGEFDDPKSDMGKLATTLRKGSKAAADMARPQVDNPWAQGVNDGIVNLFQFAPLTAGAVITKNPAIALAGMGALTGGEAFGEAKDEGKSDAQARRYAGVQGAIAILAQKIPLGQLLGDVEKGTGLFKTVAANVLREAPAMQVQTLLSDFDRWVELHPEKPVSTFLKERGPAAINALVSGAVISAGGGLVAHLGGLASNDGANGAKAVQAQQHAVILNDLMETAKASKLRERDPATFQQFVDQATKDGPVEHIYVDPQKITDILAQGDPEKLTGDATLLKAMPSVLPQMDEALRTGQDLQIPMSEFATWAAGSHFAQELLPHLKTDPNDMTLAESEAFLQDHAEELKTKVQEIMKEAQAEDASAISAGKVKDGVLGQLTEANRFTPDVNEAYATLTAAFYKTLAHRLGITPEEAYAQHPVKIAAESVAGEALTEHVQQPDAPAFRTVERGPSAKTLNAALNKSANGELRALVDDSGTLHVWDAADATHHDKAAELGIPYDVDRNDNRAWIRQEDGLPHLEFAEGLEPGAFLRNDDVLFTAPGHGTLTGREYGALLDGELTQGEKQPRGSYNPNTDLISLLKGADLSTFLHESGHFYLETLARVAASNPEGGEIVADMDKALAFMGHKGVTAADWLAQPLDARREGHERFARAFEAFLMEGKAPSTELRGVFQRFRAWLTSVYRTLAGLKVELTDDVRGVFARMLASQHEIENHAAAQGFAPLFKNAADAGMTPQEFEAYQRLGADATATAVDQLETRSIRDMRWLTGAKDRKVRELQKEGAGRRKAVQAEVTAEVMAEPVNRARQMLSRGMLDGQEVEGPHKLSLPALREMYGEGGTALEEAVGKNKPAVDYRELGYGKYGMLAEDGLHPDHVAELLGFSSGDELVRTLLTAEPAKVTIEGKTDQRMLERYGDLMDADAISRAADEALHNDARLRFVASEANALAKATGQRRVLAEAARNFAADMIANVKVRDLKPSRYQTAETRAAAAAAKAAAKGDLVTAATEKRNQVVNAYATKAAYDAQDEVAKAMRYLARFNTEGTRKALDPEYRDQIDGLLDRFDLRKGVTLREIDKRKSLAAWVARQTELGLEPVIPEELLNEANRKSYKDMTLAELRGLVDSVRNIAHLGRLKNQLLAAKDHRDFMTAVGGAVQEIADSAFAGPRDDLESNQIGDKVEKAARSFLVSARKFDSLIRRLGGFRDSTTLWDVLVRPKNEAQDREAVMSDDNVQRLHEILKPILEDKTRAKLFIPEIGRSLSLEGRIAVALNWGNEINRKRVMDGDQWTEHQVQAILKTLAPRHLKFVQDMWDHIESYKPQIAAKERKLTGVEPEWVEAAPFSVELADGTVDLRGGYYPISYDPDRSAKAADFDAIKMAKQAVIGASRGYTRPGHLKARVDEVLGRPVRKSLGVAFQHLNDVIHDLAWHEYIVDAKRLLGNETLGNAVRKAAGPEVLRSLKKAVEAMEVGDTPAQNGFEASVNYLRSGATVAGLGWNFMTSLQQPMGLLNGTKRIGAKWMGVGLSRVVGDAASMKNAVAWVHAKSDFMRLRMGGTTLSRELHDVRGKVGPSLRGDVLKSTVGGKAAVGVEKGLSAVEHSFYYVIGRMQMIADVPTWIGQYEKSMADHGDDAKAVSQADQAVRDSQGAGQIGDLSEIQRGGPLMKLWTNFYSYFDVVYNQLAESVEETQLRGVTHLPILAADVALVLILPSVLGMALKTAVQGDDWADLPKKIGADLLGSMFGMFVGLRDIKTALIDGDDSGPAGMRFLKATAQLGAQAKQGDVDEAFLKALNTEAGILFHYPASQVQRTVLGIKALADGDTKNPLAPIFGVPRKK